jgi:hypothetical protein
METRVYVSWGAFTTASSETGSVVMFGFCDRLKQGGRSEHCRGRDESRHGLRARCQMADNDWREKIGVETIIFDNFLQTILKSIADIRPEQYRASVKI